MKKNCVHPLNTRLNEVQAVVSPQDRRSALTLRYRVEEPLTFAVPNFTAHPSLFSSDFPPSFSCSLVTHSEFVSSFPEHLMKISDNRGVQSIIQKLFVQQRMFCWTHNPKDVYERVSARENLTEDSVIIRLMLPYSLVYRFFECWFIEGLLNRKRESTITRH